MDTNSAHNVLGFPVGAYDQDTLLSPEELAAAINEQCAGVTALVEEDIVSEGILGTLPGTYYIYSDLSDFISDGVVYGCIIQILSGIYGGTYSINSVIDKNTLSIRMDSTFSVAESKLKYRIYSKSVKIETTSTARGTSLEVVSDSSDMGLSAGTVYGSMDSFEAIDKQGNLLSFSGVQAGDVLEVTGEQRLTIAEIQDTLLVLSSSLPSYIDKRPFTIYSASALAYSELIDNLVTFMTSNELFSKYGFRVDLTALDTAISTVLSSGQGFASNTIRAKDIAGDLLGMLTTNHPRSEEYSAQIKTMPLNLETIISGYSAQRITGFDTLLEGLADRKYTRAEALLLDGNLKDFFNTTAETASYSGAILNSARLVKQDLPSQPGSEYGILNSISGNNRFTGSPNANNEFWDTTSSK